jgi:hypothetical protein
MYMVCFEVPSLEPNVVIYINSCTHPQSVLYYLDDDTEECRPRIVSMETTTLNFRKGVAVNYKSNFTAESRAMMDLEARVHVPFFLDNRSFLFSAR